MDPNIRVVDPRVNDISIQLLQASLLIKKIVDTKIVIWARVPNGLHSKAPWEMGHSLEAQISQPQLLKSSSLLDRAQLTKPIMR